MKLISLPETGLNHWIMKYILLTFNEYEFICSVGQSIDPNVMQIYKIVLDTLTKFMTVNKDHFNLQ